MSKQKKTDIKKRLTIAINITMFMFFMSVFFKISFVRDLKNFFDLFNLRKDIFLTEFYDLSSLAAMFHRLDILNEVLPLVEIFYLGVVLVLFSHILLELSLLFSSIIIKKKTHQTSKQNSLRKTSDIYLKNLRFLC